MFDEFEAFRTLGLKNTPHIEFALSQDRFLPLPDEVWKNTDLGVILFGAEAQRRHVLNANKFALPNLVINERLARQYVVIRFQEMKAAVKWPLISSTNCQIQTCREQLATEARKTKLVALALHHYTESSGNAFEMPLGIDQKFGPLPKTFSSPKRVQIGVE